MLRTKHHPRNYVFPVSRREQQVYPLRCLGSTMGIGLSTRLHLEPTKLDLHQSNSIQPMSTTRNTDTSSVSPQLRPSSICPLQWKRTVFYSSLSTGLCFLTSTTFLLPSRYPRDGNPSIHVPIIGRYIQRLKENDLIQWRLSVLKCHFSNMIGLLIIY